MSMDRSLKVGGGLAAKRSVLTRAERIAKMTEDKKFDAKTSKPMGLPKTLVPKKGCSFLGTPTLRVGPHV